MTEADLAAIRAQLILHEGKRLTVYADGKGIPTIGVGRNLRDKGISDRTAHQMLDEDIEECLGDLRSFSWFAALDRVRIYGLIDLRFNVGRHGLRGFTKFAAAMARQDYPTAHAELIDSDWYRDPHVSSDRKACVIAQITEGRTP